MAGGVGEHSTRPTATRGSERLDIITDSVMSMTKEEWRNAYLLPIKNPNGEMTHDEADALVVAGLVALANTTIDNRDRIKLALALCEAWEMGGNPYLLNVR